jgi:hypothetical protein
VPYFVWAMGSCMQHQEAIFLKDILANQAVDPKGPRFSKPNITKLQDPKGPRFSKPNITKFRRKGSSRIIPPSNRLESILLA